MNRVCFGLKRSRSAVLLSALHGLSLSNIDGNCECAVLSIPLHSAAQCTALHRSAGHCSVVQCRAMMGREFHCSAVKCIVMHCTAEQCSSIQCSAVQSSAALYSLHPMFILCISQQPTENKGTTKPAAHSLEAT